MSKNEDSSNSLDRRELLKLGALGVGGAALTGLSGCAPGADAGASSGSGGLVQVGRDLALPPNTLSSSPPAEPFRTAPMETVRIGFVGVGLQGGGHVRNFLGIEGVEVRALCDINVPRMEEVAGWVEAAGQPRPSLYGQGETDFVRLCETEELDLVFTATPWRWHVPVCVAAMENGKHAATEVPAAYTLEDCWRLVEVAEAQQKHCVMMENCNYDRPEMMVFNIVRQGLLGDLLHAECGYNHDLRAIKFGDANEGLWRRAHSRERNGNLYPTHGLGPIANCMDINRGDRFNYLVSMSSPSRGLSDYARANFPEGDPKRSETFALGDVNASMIKTSLGRTIYVVHDTNLPRPYTRIHMLQGSKGIFQGYPNRLHIEGRSPGHRWEDYADVLAEFDHPLWKDLEAMSEGAGHGGMDFIEDYRLVKCLREGTPTDMNVYDAAAISAVGPLSEWSVANGSQPAAFPDFTRGQWESYPPLGIFRA